MTLPATVTVTRSKHPLEGRTFRLLGRMRRHGHVELLVVLDDGTKSLLDASWTDYASAEAGPASTSTLGTLGDLLAASALARARYPRPEAGEVQAAGKPPSKEDDRAACTVESAGSTGPRASTTGAGRAGPRRRRGSNPDPGQAHRQSLTDPPRRHDERRGGRPR